MTEPQLEALEDLFPLGGCIVFKEPNGGYRVMTIGSKCPAMSELVEVLIGEEGDPGALCMVLNKHYPKVKGFHP